MTEIIRAIIVFFIVLIVCYLATAFVTWDFNPKNWETEVRAFLVWFGLFFSFFLSLASISIPKTLK